MGWILAAAVVLVLGYWAYQKNKQTELKDNQDSVVFSKQIVRYVGGIPEISGGKVFTNIRVGKEKLFVEFIGKDVIKEIDMDKVVDAECSTSEDVTRDVSLGRLIIFGVLAFGMKKSNKTITKCAVITYKDEFDKNRSLVFETNPDDLVRSILNIKREQLLSS